MIVYGDPSFEYSSRFLWFLLTLRSSTALLHTGKGRLSLDHLRTLLIVAGQFEQALADGLPGCLPADEARRWVSLSEATTDHAAAAFFLGWEAWAKAGREGPPRERTDPAVAAVVDRRRAMMRGAATILRELPDVRVRQKVPEGFAFYALFPEQYCAAALRWLADHESAPDRRALVVGVRSIGTSLSAVVAAALAARGWAVRRLTVRPGGHPFSRHVEIPADGVRDAAYALVVDEGPGLSGSSMAAVAQALAAAGLAAGRVSFLPGHGGEPGGAASDEVRAVWATTRRYVVPLGDLRWAGRSLTETLAAQAEALLGGGDVVERVEDVGGGLWRRAVYTDANAWPPAYPQFERTKYRCVLRSGRSVLWTFAGLALGPDSGWSMADAAAKRLHALAEGGWTPAPVGTFYGRDFGFASAFGFVLTPWVEAPRLTRDDGDAQVLAHVGAYVAAAAKPAKEAVDDRPAAMSRLREMLYWNTREVLGEDAAARARAWGEAAARLSPSSAVPSYGDGRLAPHEWLRTPDGRILKVDCVGHDVDHTVVGKQPVAWDVAGAIVEWGLSDDEAAAPLMNAYRAAGGADVPPALLHFYRMAYAAFRVGMCAMNAGLVGHDPDEQRRLREAEAFYRAELARLLEVAP